jgi:CBS domain-containing protein
VVENGRVIGIVTSGDVREARPSAATSLSAWELNYLLANLTVSEVMSKPARTISPEATIGEAADMMLSGKISGLPVVDANEKLVGIVTESDIFRMVVHNWRQSQEDSAKPYTHYKGD